MCGDGCDEDIVGTPVADRCKIIMHNQQENGLQFNNKLYI